MPFEKPGLAYQSNLIFLFRSTRQFGAISHMEQLILEELNLRNEFKGRRLKGTAIELSNETNTGATQVPAQEFLEIAFYPTFDLLKAIEAVGPNQGRPIAVIGERGVGKRERTSYRSYGVAAGRGGINRDELSQGAGEVIAWKDNPEPNSDEPFSYCPAACAIPVFLATNLNEAITFHVSNR